MKSFEYGFLMDQNPCFIIAEIAQNHDGSLGTAHAYIDAVADTGVDAIKFQTHIAEFESTPGEPWRIPFSLQDGSRFDYWKRMEFKETEWIGLKKHAEDRGLVFMSSPFSLEAAMMLDRIGMRIWKIASGEVSNYHMLDFVFSTGKPVIFSSGLSDYDELEKSISRARGKGLELAVLQCTSNYPTKPEEIGLNLVREMKARFSCPVGLSDHSGTIFPSLSAVTLGANIIEVHTVFDKRVFGPDVSASITLEELKTLVQGCRFIHRMMENPMDKTTLNGSQKEYRRIFNKSLYFNRVISQGEVISLKDISSKKPCIGVPATEYESVVGHRVKVTKFKDDPVNKEDLE